MLVTNVGQNHKLFHLVEGVNVRFYGHSISFVKMYRIRQAHQNRDRNLGQGLDVYQTSSLLYY